MVTKNRNYTIYGGKRTYRFNGTTGDYLGTTNYTYVRELEQSTWGQSAKVNGHLVLRPQACSMYHASCESWQVPQYATQSQTVVTPRDASYPVPYPTGDSGAWAALENEVSAKFSGKLKKGSASLGVSLGSWHQSRDMLIDRHAKASALVDSALGFFRGNPGALRRIRRDREPLANQVLEAEFGWGPLFDDIRSSLEVIGSPVTVQPSITSRARSVIKSEIVDPSNPSFTNVSQWVGNRWVTYSATVSVSNPNLWLLNRLGLINPVAVAWDLVPWSFVVNMFLNTNQLISSISDEVGLSVTNRSITKGRTFRYTNAVWPKTYGTYLGGRSSILVRTRDRTLDAKPAVSLDWKVPNLNWELAVIASSLLIQKIDRLNKLIRLI